MCDEGRIRELIALIDSEKDPEEVSLLAGELERQLSTESLSKIDGSAVSAPALGAESTSSGS